MPYNAIHIYNLINDSCKWSAGIFLQHNLQDNAIFVIHIWWIVARYTTKDSTENCVFQTVLAGNIVLQEFTAMDHRKMFQSVFLLNFMMLLDLNTKHIFVRLHLLFLHPSAPHYIFRNTGDITPKPWKTRTNTPPQNDKFSIIQQAVPLQNHNPTWQYLGQHSECKTEKSAIKS